MVDALKSNAATRSNIGLKSNSAVADYSVFSAGDVGTYREFKQSFPLQGDRLYLSLFNRHTDIIQTQKAKFAVANLQKIFAATFNVSAVSGFDRMSLRDLSRNTGMSMGAIYSCISKKEDIALMVADTVRQSSELTRRYALQVEDLWLRIEDGIRYHLYASTLLQPWYFFLFFETRCLPEQQQTESTNIELEGIKSFQGHIEEGVKQGVFHCDNPAMVANTIVVLLEDWYLKPWKHLSVNQSNVGAAEIEQPLIEYTQSLIKLVKNLLAYRP